MASKIEGVGKDKNSPCASLSMKDMTKLSAIFGVLAATLAWGHAEITIPRVLTETAIQIHAAVDRHAAIPLHGGALSQREFALWAEMREKSTDKFAEQIIHRLDIMETELRAMRAAIQKGQQ